MGMGVAVVMMRVIVGMVVRHGKMLHYNITGVHVVATHPTTHLRNLATRSPEEAGGA